MEFCSIPTQPLIKYLRDEIPWSWFFPLRHSPETTAGTRHETRHVRRRQQVWTLRWPLPRSTISFLGGTTSTDRHRRSEQQRRKRERRSQDVRERRGRTYHDREE